MPTAREHRQQLAVEVWRVAKDELDAAREKELRLRLAVIADVFGLAALKRHGTSHAELADGADLALEIRRAAKVDQDKLDAAMASLRKAIGAVKAKLIGERLIIWKPGASIAELERLAPSEARIFDGVIAIELGSPSLKLTPAKAAKRAAP